MIVDLRATNRKIYKHIHVQDLKLFELKNAEPNNKPGPMHEQHSHFTTSLLRRSTRIKARKTLHFGNISYKRIRAERIRQRWVNLELTSEEMDDELALPAAPTTAPVHLVVPKNRPAPPTASSTKPVLPAAPTTDPAPPAALKPIAADPRPRSPGAKPPINSKRICPGT